MLSEPKINVSNSVGGAGFGLFLFLSVWLIFGRGCENTPSSFEHWLNARYEYKAPNADWGERELERPAAAIDDLEAPEIEIDVDSIDQAPPDDDPDANVTIEP